MEKERGPAALGGKLGELLHGERGKKILLIAGVSAIALIFLSRLFSNGDTAAAAEQEEVFSAQEYVDSLEQRLMSVISGIEGVGEAQIMVTLEDNGEIIYANEEKKNTDRSQDTTGVDSQRIQQSDNTQHSVIIVEQSDGSRRALVRMQMEPTIRGVVIICRGGDNEVVRRRVTEAVTTALNISSRRVCVERLCDKV